MKLPKNALRFTLLGLALLFLTSNTYAQTKQLKRPKSKVKIYSVDNFVTQSFDLYDKVYKYDGYAAAGTPLDDDDIDVVTQGDDDMNDAYDISTPQGEDKTSDHNQLQEVINWLQAKGADKVVIGTLIEMKAAREKSKSEPARDPWRSLQSCK